MIRLHSCAPLHAAISHSQCAANRRRGIVSCFRCGGLGGLVAEFAGEERPKRVWGRDDYSQVGAARRKEVYRERAIAKDHALGGAMILEALDESEPRILTADFDLEDVDDLAMVREAERVAYEHGITLGDEILCRLRVLEDVL